MGFFVRYFGDEMVAKRKNMGLTQAQLAEKANVSTSAIQKIERCTYENVPREEIESVLQALDSSVPDIFFHSLQSSANHEKFYRRWIVTQAFSGRKALGVVVSSMEKDPVSVSPISVLPDNNSNYLILQHVFESEEDARAFAEELGKMPC